MITIRDKKMRNITNYFDKGCSIWLNNFTYDNAGYIYGWAICVGEKHYKGLTIDELETTLQEIKKEYNLKTYSDTKKDVMVIYCDNLLKIYGFLRRIIDDIFPKDDLGKLKSITVYDNIEFRDISVWNDELHKPVEIAEYAQFLIDKVFQNKHDKYFYYSPQQESRRLLKKYVGKDKTAKRLFPKSYAEYNYYKMAVYGGVNFAKKGIYEDYVKFDICSAYIYHMLIKRHCMSEPMTLPNPEKFESYLDKPFLGLFKITYDNLMEGIQCYKDVDDNDIPSEGTIKILLTNKDLKNFQKLANVKEIKCFSIETYTQDYLPKCNQDFLVDMFLDKQSYKHGDQRLYKIIKMMLNSAGYGDTIPNLEPGMPYKKHRDEKATTIPQWGIEALASCKDQIFTVGLAVDGWISTATDSIICKNTPENIAIIEEYNKIVQGEVKDFCDKFGYDFEKLKKLGTFELEDKIDLIRVNGHNQYCYLPYDSDEVTVKASGCNLKKVKKDMSFFNMKKFPVGERVFYSLPEETTTVTIDGIKLTSYGSYYEEVEENEEAEKMTKAIMYYNILKKLQNEQK